MSGKYWDKAWSLVEGCTPVSPACDNCWLAAIDYRFNKGFSSKGRFNGDVFLHSERLSIPLKIKKPTVFAVWSDLFHEDVPFDFIFKALGHMNAAYQHTFLILTKRPDRMRHAIQAYVIHAGYGIETFKAMFHHVYFGVTAENQEQADKRIPILLQVPAAKRFVSIEPMLGPVDLTETWRSYAFDQLNKNKDLGRPQDYINLVILGGESGHGARPMHPDWARGVRDQCEAAGVPFFFKQWGEWRQKVDGGIHPKDICISYDGTIEIAGKDYICFPNESEGTIMRRMRKTGRKLDGREHNQLPWSVNG